MANDVEDDFDIKIYIAIHKKIQTKLLYNYKLQMLYKVHKKIRIFNKKIF